MRKIESYKGKITLTPFYLILSLFLLVLLFAGEAEATDYTWDNGSGDGLWDTGANWSPDAAAGGPNSTTLHTVTFDSTSTANCTRTSTSDRSVTALTISAGYTGTLSGAYRLLVYGTGTSTSIASGAASITVKSFHYMPSNSTQTTIAAADYAGSVTGQTLSASLEMMPSNNYNGNFTLGGDVTATSVLLWRSSVTGGYTTTLDTTGYNITTTDNFMVGTRPASADRDATLKNMSATVSTIDVGGNLQIDPTNTYGTSQIQSDNINFLVAGNWTNYDIFNFTAGNSCTVTFDGTADQTIITDADAFNNLTLNNTGASGSDDIIISNTLDVDGTLTITDGDLDIGSNNPAVNTAGNVSIGASGSVSKGTGTWTFDGTGTSTWTDSTSSGQDLGAVTIDGTSKTINLGSAVKATSLTVTDTLDTTASNYGLTTSGNIAVDGTLTANGSNLTCGGDWANSGTFTAGTSTLSFDKSSATQTLNSGGTGTGKDFYHLTHSGAGTLQLSSNNLSVGGNLNNSAGTLDLNALTLTVSGSITNSATITETGSAKIVKAATSCLLTNSSGTEVSEYIIGTDSIYARVVDEDENLDGTSADTLTGVTVSGGTNGDSETLTLTETGIATEIFLSSALTTAGYDGSATANDGTLELSAGETITVAYTDDEDSSDNATSDTATCRLAIANFLVSLSSPQVAGTSFTYTITAREADGTTDVDYNRTANITLTYVSPTSGTKTLSTTSTSSFTKGVATITDTYSDAGVISITATDASDSSIYGTSSNITVVPDSFTLSTSKTTFSVNEPWTLTITAKNSAGTTTANYKGASTLSINYVTPSTSQSGTLSTATLTGSSWSSGVYTLSSFTYNKFGIITITCKDPTDTTQTGTSSQLTFLPLKLEVSLASPGGGRDFYYSGEDIATTVKALDYNGNTISNYVSSVGFTGDYLDLPSNYAFTSSDSGTHIFSDVSATDKGTTSITATDTTYSAATGTSSEFKVKEGTIRVLDTSGPVGTLPVTVKLIDSDGNDITNDSATTFTITLSESRDDGTASSTAETSEVTFASGEAEFEVTDTEAEVVTVTPVSEDYLDVISGKVTFGGAGTPRFGSGSHILWWRELRSDEAR